MKKNDEKKVKDFQKAYDKAHIKDIPELKIKDENKVTRAEKLTNEISDKIDNHIDDILNSVGNFSAANILAIIKYSIDMGCNIEGISEMVEEIIDDDEDVKGYVEEIIKDFEEEDE